MSIVSGLSSCWYVSGVPHFRQNVLTTDGEDRNLSGSPLIKAKWLRSTTIHATDGAPAASRHDRQ
jgi:hypothetical protein